MARLLRLRPGEAPFVLWIAALAWALAFGRVILLSVGNGTFLAHYTANDYGWVYLLAAVTLAVGGAAYRGLIGRLRFDRLAAGTLGVLSLGVVALWALGGHRALIPLIPAWVLVVWVFGLTILWGLASRGVDEEQAGRLFGLMGVGEVLGDVVGGLGVGVLVERLGTSATLLVSAASLAGAGALIVAITRRFPRTLDDDEPAVEELPRSSLSALESWRGYVAWIGALGALITVCWYLVDASLYRQIAARFETPAEVTAFLGLLWAGIAAGTFGVRLLIAGWALSRVGVRGILVLPGAMVCLLGAVALCAAVDWSEATFVAVAGSVIAWRVIRDGLDKPGTLLLYQAIPPRPRLAAQSLVETLGDACATGLAGLLLLLLGGAPWFGAGALAMLTATLVVCWCVVARRLIALHATVRVERQS